MKIILIVFFNCLLAVCFSQSANDYYNQAVQLRKENAYLTAVRVINQALRLDSMNAEYYSFKAKCLFELKEYYESFVVFSKGIEKNPKESLLYKDRGYILLTISEFNDAISDFTEAAKFATDDSTRKFAYTYRAIAKLRGGIL